LSILLHIALPGGAFLLGFPRTSPPQSATIPPPLSARLQPALQVEQPPELLLDVAEQTSPPSLPAPAPAVPAPAPEPRPSSSQAPLARLAAAAQRQLDRLAQEEGFYPLEAIENRWQGETWVEVFFDENGHVIAARMEESSGYPILDEAALKAARALKSLPADGLDSVILPVRFRLER
jgi:protein TonB